jgi:hypothetical protein
MFKFKPHDLANMKVPTSIRQRTVEVISHSIPNSLPTIMVRMVPGDPTTLREVEIEDLTPRTKERYVHIAEIRTRFVLPEDMLRYDCAALVDPDKPESEERGDGRHVCCDGSPILIYRLWRTKKHVWTDARWASFSTSILPVCTLDLRDPEPMAHAKKWR